MTEDELLARLRAETDGATVNPDGPDAADRIEALILERDEMAKAVCYLKDTLAEYPQSVYRDARLSAPVAEMALAQAKYEAELIAERDEAIRHVEQLQDKLDPEHSCACCYDRPDITCGHHSPMLAKAEAEVERLRTALTKLATASRRVIDAPNGFARAEAFPALGASAGEAIAALEAALTAPVGPPSPPPEWLMRVAYAAREFCEDWKKGDFSLSTLAALDAQSIVEAFEKPMDPSTRDAYAIRRAALLDAAAECAIGPSGKWSDAVKSGYIGAADDFQRRIRALADKDPATLPVDPAAIRRAALEEAARTAHDAWMDGEPIAAIADHIRALNDKEPGDGS